MALDFSNIDNSYQKPSSQDEHQAILDALQIKNPEQITASINPDEYDLLYRPELFKYNIDTGTFDFIARDEKYNTDPINKSGMTIEEAAQREKWLEQLAENDNAAPKQIVQAVSPMGQYKKHRNQAYAGCDITATIVLPGQRDVYTFADLSTLSVSTHRESFPVRILGVPNMIGTSSGPRIIAGTLIFSVLDLYPFYRAIEGASSEDMQNKGPYPLADSLPPFDITISMHNEYEPHGNVMKIFGIKIIDEGLTLSIDDLVTEQTFSFIAAGMAPIHSPSRYIRYEGSDHVAQWEYINQNDRRYTDEPRS